jgi:hypothetical protein
MKTFKIFKGGAIYQKNFATLAEAEAWTLENLGQGYTIEELPTESKPDSVKLAERQQFGRDLLNEYLLDNDAIASARGYAFTVEETAQQAQKFQLVMGILPLGSLKQVLSVIQATATDAIFTQERKDKYITALNDFINAQG